jgi:hypothetical protein
MMNQPPLFPKIPRLAAWMLALSMLPFIATVATGVVGFIASGDLPMGVTFDQITPQIMANIRLTWVLLNLFVGVAGLNIAIGVILVANALKTTHARLWMLAVMVLYSLLSIQSVFSLVVRLSVINFTDNTLGENAAYKLSGWGMDYSYPLSLLVILLLCVGLATSGLLRKTGLVVGLVSALLFVLSLFPEIRGSIPPFVFGLLATPIGIGLLRREQHTAAQNKAVVPGT